MNLRNMSELPQFGVCLLQIMQQAIIQIPGLGCLVYFNPVLVDVVKHHLREEEGVVT